VRVVSTPLVAAVVSERGGRLYVWPQRGACCGRGTITLETGQAPKEGVEFERVPVEGFELQVARMGRRPDELTLDVHGRGRRRRMAAYWDNCAWVV
jgi:hypothetical protein